MSRHLAARTRSLLLVMGLLIAAAPQFGHAANAVAPATALASVSKLSVRMGGQPIAFTPTETTLLAAVAASGTPRTAEEWIDAFLIVSGNNAPADVARRRAVVESLIGEAQQLDSSLSASERGQAVLDLLHRGPMKAGYVADQTSLSVVLDDGTYNCVSSTALYTLVAQNVGLKLQPVEFEGSYGADGHMMTLLVDGSEEIDVETTSPDGFNARSRAADAGAYVVGIRDLSEGRRIGQLGLLLSIVNNRTVQAERNGNHAESARLQLLAVGLAPGNAEVLDGAATAFANWMYALSEKKDFSNALRAARIGLSLAPDHSQLRDNSASALQQMATQMVVRGDDAGAVKLVTLADREWPGRNLLDTQSSAFIFAAQERGAANDWAAATTIVHRGIAAVDAEQRSDLEDALESYYGQWVNSLVAAGDVDAARDTLAQAVAENPSVTGLLDLGPYALQESLRVLDEQRSPADAAEWIAEFRREIPSPKVSDIVNSHIGRSVLTLVDEGNADDARTYLVERQSWLEAEQADAWADAIVDRQAQALLEQDRWSDAAEVYREELAARPASEHLLEGLASTFDAQARTAIDQQDWPAAIAIYDEGLALCPGNSLLEQNRAYCAQFLGE